MCCSTGICGTDIDPDLVNFAAMLSQLGTHGIKIERYNLADVKATRHAFRRLVGVPGGPAKYPSALRHA